MELIEQINAVQQRAVQHFSALDQPQMNWKPESKKWSIAQCLEHLVISNKNYFPFFDKILAGTYKPGLFQKINPFKRITAAYMAKNLGPVPIKKFKSPRIFRPSVSDVNPGILTNFLEQQPKIRDYFMRLQTLDTKNTYMASPVTPLIVYSVEAAMRIIAGHQQRHLHQAMQVLTHPNFPK